MKQSLISLLILSLIAISQAKQYYQQIIVGLDELEEESSSEVKPSGHHNHTGLIVGLCVGIPVVCLVLGIVIVVVYIALSKRKTTDTYPPLLEQNQNLGI